MASYDFRFGLFMVFFNNCFSDCFPVAIDHHVQFERNAVSLDFLTVKKYAVVYPHIGKDHLLIRDEDNN